MFGGPYNNDYSVLGSILGPLILGNYYVRVLQGYIENKMIYRDM